MRIGILIYLCSKDGSADVVLKTIEEIGVKTSVEIPHKEGDIIRGVIGEKLMQLMPKGIFSVLV